MRRTVAKLLPSRRATCLRVITVRIACTCMLQAVCAGHHRRAMSSDDLSSGGKLASSLTRRDTARQGRVARSTLAMYSMLRGNNVSNTPSGTNIPSPFNRRRLTVATLGISDAAIARAYTDPTRVRESTLLRLQKAALELGLPLPGQGVSR